MKPEADAFVFTGAKGAQLRRSTFRRNWRRGIAAAGLTEEVHIHTDDDRHQSVAQKMSELIEKELPAGPNEADRDDLPEASGR